MKQQISIEQSYNLVTKVNCVNSVLYVRLDGLLFHSKKKLLSTFYSMLKSIECSFYYHMLKPGWRNRQFWIVPNGNSINSEPSNPFKFRVYKQPKL